MARTGRVSVQAARLDRKLPSTSDGSVGTLAHRREPPIYLYRGVASSCPASPICAEHPANRRSKLSPRIYLRGRWRPSFRRKYPAATADRPRSRCARAPNVHTPADGQASAHQASAWPSNPTPPPTFAPPLSFLLPPPPHLSN